MATSRAPQATPIATDAKDRGRTDIFLIVLTSYGLQKNRCVAAV